MVKKLGREWMRIEDIYYFGLIVIELLGVEFFMAVVPYLDSTKYPVLI